MDNVVKIISLEDEAFYELLNIVGEYMKGIFNSHQERWINDKEAMSILNIRSKTTLQKIRDQGLIRFSQPEKKIILYDRHSILEYIERNVRDVYQ